MNDFATYFHEIFEKLKLIKKFEIYIHQRENFAHEANVYNRLELLQNTMTNNYHLKSVTQLLDVSYSYQLYKNINISVYSEYIIKNKELKTKFVTALNYILDTLVTPEKFEQITVIYNEYNIYGYRL